jgi:hypothetical protein
MGYYFTISAKWYSIRAVVKRALVFSTRPSFWKQGTIDITIRQMLK